METIKQVTLISSDPQMLENRGPWSWQGSNEDIWDGIEIYDLHWKRTGSVDEGEKVICRLGWMWLEWDVTTGYLSIGEN